MTPFSGEIDSDTAGTTKVSDLGLGCLYIGGGNSVAVPPGAIPDNTRSINDFNGNQLFGSDGTGPADCTKAAGPAKSCINNDAQPSCTSDANCGGTIAACQPVANCYFGPPLGIPNTTITALTTCVVNVVQTDGGGTFDRTTGTAAVGLLLSSRVYVTGNSTSPCPQCCTPPMGGTCSGTCAYGARAGMACMSSTSLGTSIDCQPEEGGGAFQAPLPINLTPLVTTQQVVTSADGNFCPSQRTPGAFGHGNVRRIVQNGSPGGDLTDEMPHPEILGYSFCIPATGNTTIDGIADTPGPGSVALNGVAQMTLFTTTTTLPGATTTTTSTTTTTTITTTTTTMLPVTTTTLPPCGGVMAPTCLGSCAIGTCLPSTPSLSPCACF
jgi:hypothetical protein